MNTEKGIENFRNQVMQARPVSYHVHAKKYWVLKTYIFVFAQIVGSIQNTNDLGTNVTRPLQCPRALILLVY